MRILSVIIMLLFSAGFCQKAAAQSQSLSFEELQRQMLELQRRMMQQLQSSPFDNRGFAMPQGRDTTYYFHFDTTFDGGSMSQFFRFSPFGSDSTGDAGQGFDDFFNRFFGSDNPSGMPDGNSYQLPSDDGNQPKTDDDLLPEERLRQQEGAAKPKKNAPPAKPAEPKPDPKIKTIHI